MSVPLSAPVRSPDKAASLADFAAAGAGGISLGADGMSQDPDTDSEDGFIAILVGASIYEIPIWLRT